MWEIVHLMARTCASANPFQNWQPAGTNSQVVPARAPVCFISSQFQVSGDSLALKAAVLLLEVSCLPWSDTTMAGVPRIEVNQVHCRSSASVP